MHVVSLIKEILPWLEQGAKLTATTFDDMAVEVFRAALDNVAIAAWLESLFHADAETRVSLAAGASPEVQAAFAARGIDWQKLIEMLPTILKIISLFA